MLASYNLFEQNVRRLHSCKVGQILEKEKIRKLNFKLTKKQAEISSWNKEIIPVDGIVGERNWNKLMSFVLNCRKHLYQTIRFNELWKPNLKV